MGTKKLDPAIAARALTWIEESYAGHGLAFGPRAWAYLAEVKGHLITKNQFDSFERWLSDMRKRGLLDPDMVSDDTVRETILNDVTHRHTPEEYARAVLGGAHDLLDSYTPVSWWEGLPTYIETTTTECRSPGRKPTTCTSYTSITGILEQDHHVGILDADLRR